MKALHVIYDGRCAICRRCRGWLGRQAAFVPLAFVRLQSPEVSIRFPGIEQFHPEERLIVISDEGDVWRGESAWIMCLWALCEYRELAQRLANPLLKPFARKACELISENRHAISQWFTSEPIERLRDRLASVPGDVGVTDGNCKTR